MAGDFAVSARLVGARGGLMDIKGLKRDIARENQRFAKRMKRSFELSTATWNHYVQFHQETSSDQATVTVYTVDDVYFFLDEGTSIRYMVMTEDFSPKTRPGSLRSVKGAGGPSHFDFEDPREGIQARDFSKQVEEKHGPEYQAAIERLIDQAARKNT